MDARLLGIYLEDHVAGAVGGLRLARRFAAQNRGDVAWSAVAALVPELELHLATAERVARAIGRPPSRAKQVAVAAAELVGRLKPNGRLLHYSPLSRLLELEGLVIGSRGRAGLWRVLEDVARSGAPALRQFDFADLAARAERQIDELEALRRAAARLAFEGRGG